MLRTQENYFDWLVGFIGGSNDLRVLNNSLLLNILFNRVFIWDEKHVPMDRNRASDGLDLRQRYFDVFSEKDSYSPPLTINEYPVTNNSYSQFAGLDAKCTILEMLIALAIRCEDSIMGDNETDNTSRWFWKMIDNLGLRDCKDESYINYILDNFENRTYDFDGQNGGLFHVKNPRDDLRKVDIWYQMCWWLNQHM